MGSGTPILNPPRILQEEILSEARHQSEEIVKQAQEEARGVLERAVAEAGRLRQEAIARAQAEASRRADLILATIPVEAGRKRSERVEECLEIVRKEVTRRLMARDGFDYREALVVTAVQAVNQMSGALLELKLSPADYAGLGQRLMEEISRQTGRPVSSLAVSEDRTIAGGGLVVQNREGSQVWDNRLASRLERLWPELRRQIADQVSLVAATNMAGGAV